MTLATLIDKKDNAEIIRSQIADILAAESAAQVLLAATAGKPDPLEWELKVYEERATPWEFFRDATARQSPIVNVWWDSSSFDGRASNVVERQKSVGTFNIDCYGHGLSADDGATGHTPGDMDAAFSAQRAVRLVRNILMAGEYTYLGLRGTVWKRFPQSITTFQPQQENKGAQHVIASRFALAVDFSEFSPQGPEETLEELSFNFLRTSDGQVILDVEYDYTT